jgi:hypothetical protein
MLEHQSDAAAERRRAARASWPIRVYRLGSEPGDDLSSTTTAAERLAWVWELTQRSWALTGRPIPSYPRTAMPVTARRRV